MTKRVIIFGAGPAGLAAAYTLVENTKPRELEIILIEQGKRVEERKATSEIDRAYGVSGVGPYSDGKFLFDTIIGKRQIGSNIHEIAGIEKELECILKSKEMFKRFYVPIFGEMKEITPERLRGAEQIKMIAGMNGMDYIVAHDYHIGTDRLPELMKTIQDYLEKAGVKIITQERVVDFGEKSVRTLDSNDQNKDYACDYILCAPGRDGSVWLQKTLKEKNIAHKTRPIDIGYRIEADSAVLKRLTDIERDVKLEFRHPNGDLIRTFCVCPYGKVAVEGKKPEFGGLDFRLVNGASSSVHLSDNTNFALLVRMPLREDCDNAGLGTGIAELYKKTGASKITLQKMGDFKQQRSSKSHKIPEWRVRPTLEPENYLVGDVRIGMSGRILDDLRYGITRLSVPGLMQGLDGDDTLLYGPEIKMHGVDILTNEFLESKSMENFFIAGDGTGVSRGIGGAMASGTLAAEGILKKLGYDLK